jgi:NADH-quinone oxidoreductase subunit M
MLKPDDIRELLPLVLALPVLAAILLPLLARNGLGARRSALSVAILHLILTGLIVASAYRPLADRRASVATPAQRGVVFAPEFVPGSPRIMDAGAGKQDADPHGTSWDVLPFSSGDAKVRAIQFYIGLDGLNVWLVLLTSLMTVPVILYSWGSVREREAGYYGWLFLLQAGLLGVFLAFDVILFYVCFELTLVPLFFLIGGWGGGASRREAARKLFLYTLAGGLITLLGIAGTVLAVHSRTGTLTFSIPELAALIQERLTMHDPAEQAFWRDIQPYLFLTLAVGFAVKTPLVPFHSWLPGAYADGPLGITVMLAALLAKMGVFGLVRICLPFAPDAALSAGLPIIGTLGAIGILYGALCAYAQPDFKRLVAYSSVSHLGFCALALMAFNAQGLAGGVLHMVNHGLSTGAMFLVVGMLVDRYTSGQIRDYSGIWARLPVLTFFMMVFALASIGLPALNNFVSEMLMMSSLFDLRNAHATSLALAVAAAAGIFLSAWYTLTMIRRAFFGPLREPAAAVDVGPASDLSRRELLAVGPLAALCLLIGIAPQPLLDAMKRDTDTLARVADESRARLNYPTTSYGVPPSPGARR